MKRRIIMIIILAVLSLMLSGCLVVETRGPHKSHGHVIVPIVPVSGIEIEISD